MSEREEKIDVLELAVEIVSSYVSNNSVPATELPSLLSKIHVSLTQIAGEPTLAVKTQPSPAVTIKQSVTDDHIVCLEDGKPFKSLKRHLQSVHGMSPEDYRSKWGLNRDYPMVAPAYAQARSALAKGMGLGASRREAPPTKDSASQPAPTVEPEAEVLSAPRKLRSVPKDASGT